jgi:hypothetical protein
MKIIKNFQRFTENVGEDLTEYELKIQNEYSKLQKGKSTGEIDLGRENEVSKTMLHNLKMTYPGDEVILKDGHYLLVVTPKKNENKMDMYGRPQDYKTTLSDFGPELNWFIVDVEEGRAVSGWEYLADAFEAFIERYINELEGDYDELEEVRYEMIEDIDEFMMEFGYGEPEDDMDEYDSDEITKFLKETIYPKYRNLDKKYVIRKRDDLE